MALKGFPNGITQGQQYNIGEKPTFTLYTYINHHVGTPKLFLTFSAFVANPKKTTLHGGRSRSWSSEEENKEKEVWQRPPPPRAARSEKKINKIKKSRDASTCLGATQVGVTQVVSVRLASVQGFLRLVS